MSRFLLSLSCRRHGPSHTPHLPMLPPLFATQLVSSVSSGTAVETHKHTNVAVNLINVLKFENIDRCGHRICAAKDLVKKATESEPLSLSGCGSRVGRACGNSAVGRNAHGKDGAIQTAGVERTSDVGRAVTIEDLVEKTAKAEGSMIFSRCCIQVRETVGSSAVTVGDFSGGYSAIRGPNVESRNGDGRVVAVENLVEKTAQPQALASLW